MHFVEIDFNWKPKDVNYTFMATDKARKMKIQNDNFQNHENQFMAAIAGEYNKNTGNFITPPRFT